MSNEGMYTPKELKEKLAAIEHQRWGDWQKYVHDSCIVDRQGLIIPHERLRAWNRQIATPYKDLSEKEKESDREQVDRYWPLIEKLLKQHETEAKRRGFYMACGLTGVEIDETHKLWKTMLAELNNTRGDK